MCSTKDPKVRVLQGPEASHLYSNFTVTRKPFDDVRVRQALIGYGLNRPAIAKAAMLGYATPSISFVSPGARGHLDLSERYPHNPERARALLKEAGFDEKNPLRYTIMTHGAEPSGVVCLTTMILPSWRLLNVQVTVSPACRLMAPGAEPSLQVALVRSQPAGVSSATE